MTKSERAQGLCVFAENGKVCGKPHNSYTHYLGSAVYDHPYTPPAETGRCGFLWMDVERCGLTCILRHDHIGPHWSGSEWSDGAIRPKPANEPAETKAGLTPLGEAAKALIRAGLAKDSVGTLEKTKAGPLCYDCNLHRGSIRFSESAMDMIHGGIIDICKCCYFKRVEKAWNDVNDNYLKLKAEQGDCQ